ncbi:MAG TPA: tetratricopeptide repeat protein [bacterium]|nr:tetratricopeptide repeat protein [bacterium]
MILTIVFICLLVLGIAVLLWVILRKLPQLKIIDPSTSKEAKTKGVKNDILRKRFERVSSEKLASVKTRVGGPFKFIQDGIRKTAARLMAIERSYVDKQKVGARRKPNAQELRRMIDEARALLDGGSYDDAEKKLVEVLSMDPKNADAYEYIGRLYILTKNIENAKEAFKYLQKLTPQNASVLASLGEIANIENDTDGAFTYFSRAKNISPNNPKYLDFFIEAAIKKGDVMEANLALNHLKEVNPDNQKISVFEERIEEVRAKKHQTK